MTNVKKLIFLTMMTSLAAGCQNAGYDSEGKKKQLVDRDPTDGAPAGGYTAQTAETKVAEKIRGFSSTMC